jgi:hypothetical protein
MRTTVGISGVRWKASAEYSSGRHTIRPFLRGALVGVIRQALWFSADNVLRWCVSALQYPCLPETVSLGQGCNTLRWNGGPRPEPSDWVQPLQDAQNRAGTASSSSWLSSGDAAQGERKSPVGTVSGRLKGSAPQTCGHQRPDVVRFSGRGVASAGAGARSGISAPYPFPGCPLRNSH